MQNLSAIAICLIALFFFSCKKEIREEKVNPNASIAGSINSDGLGEEEAVEYEPTFKDYLFDHVYDSAAFISQTMSNGNNRTLKRYNTPSEFSHHLYVLVENIPEGDIANHAFVISEQAITQADLEAWVVNIGEIYLCNNGELTQPSNGRVMAHMQSERYELDIPYAKVAPPISTMPDAPPACTDWYWTIWNPETGDIIDEMFLFTTCPTTGGGGWGSGTNPPPIEGVVEEVKEAWPEWWVAKNDVFRIKSLEYLKGIHYKVPVGQPAIPSIFTNSIHRDVQFQTVQSGWTWGLGSALLTFVPATATSAVSGQVSTVALGNINVSKYNTWKATTLWP